MPASAPPTELASDVVKGLLSKPKRLPPKYFYDALGSSLFESICRLPWYPITRAEQRLLARHAPAIACALATRGAQRHSTVVELGCGSGEKLARIGGALQATAVSADVHLIDVSRQALRKTRRRLRRFHGLTVIAHATTYEEGLSRVRAARRVGPALVLLLGSNIGNFDPPDAAALLAEIRAALNPGDLFLLGADLVKPEAELLLAYDDPLGVTAAFNKNLLVRINRELDAAFDLTAFDHRAVWNGHARRVEMHLVSRCAQRVPIRALGLVVEFDNGESIWTESSHKYEPDEIAAMGAMTGFTVVQQWIDARARFALTLLENARDPR